jgi:hypothetical protein
MDTLSGPSIELRWIASIVQGRLRILGEVDGVQVRPVHRGTFGGHTHTMVTDRPQFLDIDVEAIKSFRSSHPYAASQTQELLWLEWVLFSLVCHSSASFTSLTAYSVNQVHEYHREASLLCMRGRPNIGLALTRMACELSRDVLRFARDHRHTRSYVN